MKTLITLIAIGITMLHAKANPNHSAFNLKMFDNGVFSVVIDNSVCLRTNVFSAQNIEPGYHKLKVTRFVPGPYGYNQVSTVVFKGWISIPPKSVVYAQIDYRRQLDVVRIDPYYCVAIAGNCTSNNPKEDHVYDYKGNGGVSLASPVPMCMSAMDFTQLKNNITGKAFEDSRVQITKQALLLNYFTSAQVAELMQLFSFESNKLELAKFSFNRVLDKKNYFLVNDAFSFESSIGELNQYIAMGK